MERRIIRVDAAVARPVTRRASLHDMPRNFHRCRKTSRHARFRHKYRLYFNRLYAAAKNLISVNAIHVRREEGID